MKDARGSAKQGAPDLGGSGERISQDRASACGDVLVAQEKWHHGKTHTNLVSTRGRDAAAPGA